MDYFFAFFLGIVQWITEFLPVSSSGHLIFFQEIFWDSLQKETSELFLFDVVLHFWSVCALVLYYHRSLWNIIRDFFSFKWGVYVSPEKKMGWFIALSVFPLILTGVLFWDFLEMYAHSFLFIACMFLISAMFFFLAEWMFSKKSKTSDLSFIQVCGMSVAQACAVIPGISRSWATLSTGILMGIDRKQAIDFSFLMGIPAILWAVCYQLLFKWDGQGENIWFLCIGFITSFLFSLISIHFFIQVFKRYSLRFFAYYLCIVACVSFIFNFLF